MGVVLLSGFRRKLDVVLDSETAQRELPLSLDKVELTVVHVWNEHTKGQPEFTLRDFCKDSGVEHSRTVDPFSIIS
jgi:hypothetical protein